MCQVDGSIWAEMLTFGHGKGSLLQHRREEGQRGSWHCCGDQFGHDTQGRHHDSKKLCAEGTLGSTHESKNLCKGH